MEIKALRTVLMMIFLSGCTTVTSKLTYDEWSNDATLQKSGIELATDYLNDQASGGANTLNFFSTHSWGGVTNFLNLHEWKIVSNKLYGKMPAAECRLKLENAMGGVLWSTYRIGMDYDKSLRDQGDKYNGLRIWAVLEVN